MSEPFLSSTWHLVAPLKPRLQPHAEIARQRARGRTAYVIRNPASGRTYRFPPNVYLVLSLLDGKRTVAEAWSLAAQQLDEAAPTQDETIRLLAQLHEADLLQSDKAPEVTELVERRMRVARGRLLQAVGNPLAVRIPLWDPDRFLNRTLAFVRPLVGRLGVLLWLAVMLPSLVLAGAHWGELTADITDRILAGENLLLMALVFPAVKALHELGHAYTVKAGGGEVHEIGVMFLVLLPIPYVDASAANTFRSKWHRAGVGAAGILVETFLAAVALQVWLLVEPGLVRSIAFNVMAISGISTVLFNGNPLLRFDGYFILCDVADAPNLAHRAAAYWGWLVERYAFGRAIEPPAAAPGERRLFLIYAPAALLYRLFIMASIALLVAQKVLFVGVLIAIWGLTTALVLPVWRWAWRVAVGPSLAAVRGRAIGVSLSAVAVAAGLLFLLPMPLHTFAEGVIWLPEESIVRAGGDGFVRGFLTPPGSAVVPGAQLLRSEDRDLESEILVQQARVEAAAARLARDESENPLRAELARREMTVESSALSRATERWNELEVRARAAGVFVVPRADDLVGRFHRRGDILGYIATPSKSIARVVVRQNDVDLVRGRLRGVAIRTASNIPRVFAARVVREMPAASDQFPSPALTLEGGGSQAVDRRDPDSPRALSRLFQFDIELPVDAARAAVLGEHVWVRFYHGLEPLGLQWWRRIRQLLLSRFDA